jgi:hypothetical protein
MIPPPGEFELFANEKGQWVLRRPGQDDLAEVRVRRAFPWSNPERYASVRNKEGKEVLLIPDLNQLPSAVAEAVRTALRTASLVPKIVRITKLQTEFGHQQWEVETDRGSTAFRVQEREDVRFLPDGRFSVKDADGNIYELPPVEQLDAPSRKLLDFLI